MKTKYNIESHKGENGATMLEYALLVSLIALTCIIGVSSVGFGAAISFDKVSTHMASGTGFPDGLPAAP